MSRSEFVTAVNARLHADGVLDADIDYDYVMKLEAGKHHWPRDGRRRSAMRAVLHVRDDAEIGFHRERRSRADEDAQTFIESNGRSPDGATAGDPRLPDLLTLDDIRFHGRTDDDWNSFSVVTATLAQQRQAVPPAALLSLVEAHRDCLLTLFRKADGDSAGGDIGAMLGEASIVASRLWSAQGNRNMALAHCAYARALADRLGNIRLGATARIFESNLHSGASTLIHADGNIMTGLRLLDEAATAAEHLSWPARARIAAEQAQTYAALNMRAETEAALDRAREAAAGITSSNRTGLFSDWTSSRLDVYEGTCRILLNEPAAAIVHLEQASTVLDKDPENTNVALAAHVDLASAYALTGNLDLAGTTLGNAYERLKRIGNLRGISRARRAREGLRRWNNEPAIRELDERMAAA